MPSTSEPPRNCWLPSGFSKGKKGSARPCGPKTQCFYWKMWPAASLQILLRLAIWRLFFYRFSSDAMENSPLRTYFLLLWDIYIHLLCIQQYLPSKKYWLGILVASNTSGSTLHLSKHPETIRQINSTSSWNLLKYFRWSDDSSMIEVESLKVSLHINNPKYGFSSALVVNVIFPHSGCWTACWQRELMHKAAAWAWSLCWSVSERSRCCFQGYRNERLSTAQILNLIILMVVGL